LLTGAAQDCVDAYYTGSLDIYDNLKYF
jgi:hypothetical protein